MEGRYFDPKYLEFLGRINLLKGGMLFADGLSTVSRRYAEEIRTAEFACRLEGVLQTREKNFYGILNGADYTQWNPQSDPYIVENHGPDNLAEKKKCKRDLQELFELPQEPSTPLVGMVARLDKQKGIDILLDVLDKIVDLDMQLVLLGTGAAGYEKALAAFNGRGKRIGVKIAFDNSLAHKIEASADMFLMHSLYEPYGFNQIYSLKYRTIPIVRALPCWIRSREPIRSTAINRHGRNW